jgi:hypothetical protein
MQLAFGWLRHGDEGDLLQSWQTLFFIGLSFRTVTPAGPSSLRELARLTVPRDTRSTSGILYGSTWILDGNGNLMEPNQKK